MLAFGILLIIFSTLAVATPTPTTDAADATASLKITVHTGNNCNGTVHTVTVSSQTNTGKCVNFTNFSPPPESMNTVITGSGVFGCSTTTYHDADCPNGLNGGFATYDFSANAPSECFSTAMYGGYIRSALFSCN